MAYISKELRELVVNRANNCCEYCRLSQEDYPFSFHIEHIRAEKHGGETTSENLCLSCPTCNAFKGSDLTSFDEETEQIVRLFNPRTDSWDENFDTENGIIFAKTAIARVTVFLLRFNTQRRIKERKALGELNRYPCLPND